MAALALGLPSVGVGPARADAQAPPLRVVTTTPDKPRPAESGAHDSAATVGPLAIGADVRDATGAEIGRIVVLTTDKQGRSVAKVRLDEDTYMIPVAALRARRGGVISAISRDALKHGGDAIAASGAR